MFKYKIGEVLIHKKRKTDKFRLIVDKRFTHRAEYRVKGTKLTGTIFLSEKYLEYNYNKTNMTEEMVKILYEN